MDAAALQQRLKPRTQPETSHAQAAWMRAQLRNPPNSATVFAQPSTRAGVTRATLDHTRGPPGAKAVPIRH